MQMYIDDCTFARHHEELRATATNMIIAVTAGILGVVALDQKLNANDLPLTLFLSVLGIFGAVFSSKHYERCRLHLNRSKQYMKTLERIAPDTELSVLREKGNAANKNAFPRLYSLRLNSLWLALHMLVSLLGISMSVLILLMTL